MRSNTASDTLPINSL